MPDKKTEAEIAAEAKAAEDKKAEEEAAAKAAEDKKPETKPDPEKWDEERAKATIQTQRESEAAALKRAKDAEAKLKKIEDDQLSESEKLKKDAEDGKRLAAEATETLRKAKLLAELAKPEYGLVNASAAAKLIEGVESDDDGSPTNLGSPDEDDSLIGKFLGANDYLKGIPTKPKAPSTDANEAGGGSEDAPELTAVELSAAKASGMSPKEYAAFKDADDVTAAKAALDISSKKD